MKTTRPRRPFVDAPQFADVYAYRALLRATLPTLPPPTHVDFSGVASAKQADTLTVERERWAFLAYNAARREHHSTGEARWLERASHLREYIVRHNVGLVGFGYHRLRSMLKAVDSDTLAADGLLGLLRAVERFNVTLGFKFSTYAVRIVLNSLKTTSMRDATRRTRLSVRSDGGESLMGEACGASTGGDPAEQLATADEAAHLRHLLATNAAGLTDDERVVIEGRYFGETDTLVGVGAPLGVSKERVRQIQLQALAKLRRYFDVGPLVTTPAKSPSKPRRSRERHPTTEFRPKHGLSTAKKPRPTSGVGLVLARLATPDGLSEAAAAADLGLSPNVLYRRLHMLSGTYGYHITLGADGRYRTSAAA